ncbi:hypothetical protein ID866_8497 [Astraeus odoratus]|nr:hypothetical protein ID866_8497 [Astraeus odoratus]
MGSKADPPGEVNVEVVGEPQEAKAEQSMEAAALESQGGDSRELHGVNDGASTGIVQPLGPADQDPRAAPFQFTNEGRIEVSEILRGAVLQAIQSTVKSLPTASFPIAAGTYYSSYILPFRPAYLHNHRSETDGSSPAAAEGRRQGTSPYPPIDIKHSSYKSLTALFKSLDKQRILTLKDMKPEPLVTSVSASHPDVVSHRSYVTLRDVQLRQEKREKREEEERSRVKEMEIRELWKPHVASGSGRFFLEGGFDTSALYTYAELKAAVVKYITARQLINARDQSYANVSADELLLNTLAGKNESHENLEFLKREEVVQRLSEKMQSWYEVCAEGKEPVLKKGQLKPISVVVKTRQGRRASTLISGFEPFCIEADEMAEELRRICAGATSVSPIHGKATGMEVSVQGKQIKAVTNFLHSRGVPKKWIEAVDQTGKK